MAAILLWLAIGGVGPRSWALARGLGHRRHHVRVTSSAMLARDRIWTWPVLAWSARGRDAERRERAREILRAFLPPPEPEWHPYGYLDARP